MPAFRHILVVSIPEIRIASISENKGCPHFGKPWLLALGKVILASISTFIIASVSYICQHFESYNCNNFRIVLQLPECENCNCQHVGIYECQHFETSCLSAFLEMITASILELIIDIPFECIIVSISDNYDCHISWKYLNSFVTSTGRFYLYLVVRRPMLYNQYLLLFRDVHFINRCVRLRPKRRFGQDHFELTEKDVRFIKSEI